jgi:hypothetical protein
MTMSNDTIKMLNQILVGQKIAEVRRSELSKKYKELANQLEVVLDSGAVIRIEHEGEIEL